MTGIIIDAVIVIIVVFCAYRGFRGGVVRGVCGFLALILSLVIANAAASTFSGEFKGVLSPFVGGLVDGQIQKILMPDANTPSEETDDADDEEAAPAALPDEGDYDTDTTFGMSMLTLRKLGFFKGAAERISKSIDDETSEVGYALGGIISDKLCSALAYIAVFAIAFMLLAIVFAVAGNLLNFAFSLPGLRLLDQIAGTVLGVLRGLVIVFFIATVLRYFGIVTAGTVEKTSILEYLVNNNPVANALRI
ncbi:MAG: CvpA family protein [Oscillospiraceae bacterium]|jgi:uncharacterized membrane protein required for colicin V production|nr:CvpA family protein [Oscillospiraceae bacterium]